MLGDAEKRQLYDEWGGDMEGEDIDILGPIAADHPLAGYQV